MRRVVFSFYQHPLENVILIYKVSINHIPWYYSLFDKVRLQARFAIRKKKPNGFRFTEDESSNVFQRSEHAQLVSSTNVQNSM